MTSALDGSRDINGLLGGSSPFFTTKNINMAKQTKDEAFTELISLYDIADELENSGNPERAQFVREKLDKVGAFIQSLPK
jgi:hypothetical protein